MHSSVTFDALVNFFLARLQCFLYDFTFNMEVKHFSFKIMAYPLKKKWCRHSNTFLSLVDTSNYCFVCQCPNGRSYIAKSHQSSCFRKFHLDGCHMLVPSSFSSSYQQAIVFALLPPFDRQKFDFRTRLLIDSLRRIYTLGQRRHLFY